MSLALVTCGPASEPIDDVRQITNFSTGELGVLLAEALHQAGCEVICYKGKKATWPDPTSVKVERFGSNADLLTLLKNTPNIPPPTVIFHVAALADFQVAEVTDASGNRLFDGKISSSLSEIHLRLVSAPKILPLLPNLFPNTRIIAWKYEVVGSKDDVLEKGRQQLTLPGVVASVLNGPAYGPGFGILTACGFTPVPDKHALVQALVRYRPT